MSGIVPSGTISSRPRPCDACRKRKSRCVLRPSQSVCVLCQFHEEECTFIEDPPRQSHKRASDAPRSSRPKKIVRSNSPMDEHDHIRNVKPVTNYDALRGPSLLKRSLGLQHHCYSSYIGPSDEIDAKILEFCEFDEKDECDLQNGMSFRKVSDDVDFVLKPYNEKSTQTSEIEQADAIEKVIAPHGPKLIDLYFRTVHPAFPILHKEAWLEKYSRTHREFEPPVLAGVYILALNWWHYDRELSVQKKPDINILARLAKSALQDIIHRPKLSTLQAGLLLLQLRSAWEGPWGLSVQLVAAAQELGLHLDCRDWRIPTWEKGLRRRLAWSIYMLDKTMALTHGRPSHIMDDDWDVGRLTDDDFPETSSDQNEVEGSAAVESGRIAFKKMIALSEIISSILRNFYSAKALGKFENIECLLEAAKPIQINLRAWHHSFPEVSRMDLSDSRKLSSTGSLHLAYYSAEINLHKAIISYSTRHHCDPGIVEICRGAAKIRVTAAVEFVKSLKVEHFQSFWYLSSGMNLVYIGSFATLMFLTSQSLDEASFYKQLLNDYRWTLRISSRLLHAVEFAVQRLDVLLSHLDKVSPQDVVRKMSQASSLTFAADPEDGSDGQTNVEGQIGHPKGRPDHVDYAAMLDSDGGSMLWQQISGLTNLLPSTYNLSD
ncbi:MAG: Fungal specific transcription factor [Claussenomyces sp. TS43310]|nr:MAG: Fungal specific transcription factor [Claussenomyces sp. TS43310]